MSEAPLVRVEDLTVKFVSREAGRAGRTVNGVSFTLAKGEVLGIHGESGSGTQRVGTGQLQVIS